jgi:pimeloyl-[acyl-carrier protein] methyl ester esterase
MPQLYTQTLGAGPDLVLVHGWGMNSTIWQPILPALAMKYRVTCIDLPGHGRSPDVEWPIERAVDLMLAVAPSCATWVGWSLGGMLATVIADQFPQRVSGLLTVASNVRFTQTDQWQAAIPADMLASFAQALERDPSAVLQRFVALQFLGVPVDKGVVKQIQRNLAEHSASLNGLRQGFKLLGQLDLREVFASLDVPMLALFGRLDKLVPVKAAKTIHALNAAVQITIIEQAGHAPFVSHPSQFIKQVDSFVGH